STPSSPSAGSWGRSPTGQGGSTASRAGATTSAGSSRSTRGWSGRRAPPPRPAGPPGFRPRPRSRPRRPSPAPPPAPPTPPPTLATPPAPGSLPERFGRYHILRRLGQGGMGSVYLAHDTELDRQVALKVPQLSSTGDTEVVQRFLREARAVATLKHPNVCPV